MHTRMQNFTDRTVGKREQLYEPDADRDHGASYDYIVGIFCAFGITLGILMMLFAGFVLR